MASSVSPDLYTAERYRVGKFYCDLCGNPWPLSHRREQISDQGTGGAALYVGVICCYEPDGGTLDRDLRRAQAASIAAQLSAKELQPPFGQDDVYYPGISSIVPQAWITSFAPSPLILTRGGAAQSLVLTGVGFTGADVFKYGSSGITDAVPPSLVGSTQWTLSVQASGGMAVGNYAMTYNLDIFQAVFNVR
jgi:hypothetical protein